MQKSHKHPINLKITTHIQISETDNTLFTNSLTLIVFVVQKCERFSPGIGPVQILPWLPDRYKTNCDDTNAQSNAQFGREDLKFHETYNPFILEKRPLDEKLVIYS